ncbi:MAG TPA: hypothetical protein PK289_01685 [Bacteroidia bacterium]|jgi:hypothetical protein|nr:hypothetical protein [Bacteroidia bacterium]HRG52613.1 hypothetical protein [Bacteroidia bacterium]
MPWNFLILPLIAGYYLLTRSHFFKFKQQRLDTQRLIFETVLLSVIITIITYVIRAVAEFTFPSLIATLYKFVPMQVPYIGTAIFTLIFSMVFTETANFFIPKHSEKFVRQAIQSVGNEFERMLESSFTEGVLMQFTLDNNKFYIGWVKQLPIPSISNYIRIIPAISGYRNEELELVFTSQYLSVYSEYIREGKITDIEELKIDIILNVKNIVSVGYFDKEMYNRFNRLKEK